MTFVLQQNGDGSLSYTVNGVTVTKTVNRFAFRKNGGGYYTDKQYHVSAQITCSIAHRYKIPVDRKHIFGHYNVPSNLSSHTLCSDKRGIAGDCGGVNHHSDPGPYWNWTKYMRLVASCVKAAG